MQSIQLVTDFSLEKQSISQIKAFIGGSFTSPYLEKQRQVINIGTKSSSSPKKKWSWGDIEKDKAEDEELDLRTVSEERLNDSLEELTDEDYEDFGEIGIELLDYVLDRGFIFLGRQPAELDSIAKKKKERLKQIAGRLFRKWGVRFSLEMLGGFLLVGYIHMRFKQSEKIDKSQAKNTGKSKVIQMNSIEKKADKTINKDKKQPAKKSIMG